MEITIDPWLVILISILNAAVAGFGVAMGQEIFRKLEARRKKMINQIMNGNSDKDARDKLQDHSWYRVDGIRCAGGLQHRWRPLCGRIRLYVLVSVLPSDNPPLCCIAGHLLRLCVHYRWGRTHWHCRVLAGTQESYCSTDRRQPCVPSENKRFL